jgi:hypothetical protein
MMEWYGCPESGTCSLCGGVTIDGVCGDLACGEPWHARLRLWLCSQLYPRWYSWLWPW